MCLALPRLVLQVGSERVEIDLDGVPTWVGAYGIPNLQTGDYVLVHAGQVLELLTADEAEEMRGFYRMLEDASR